MPNRTKWSIDKAHSEIAFKVRHLMIAYVKGVFKTFDASIYTKANNFTAVEIDLWIDASSITTGDAKRDEHLKGADFFDIQNHKRIAFTSTAIEKADANGNHDLWGELTMKGVTRNIKLTVQFGGIVNDPWGNERAGFTVTGKINRGEWGLKWNKVIEAGGLMVSDEVTISCEVELTSANQKEIIAKPEPAILQKSIL